MRVLILTQTYVPEPDTKMHMLAVGLVARGHHVSVLTGFPNYPTGRIYPGYRQRPWRREVLDGVNILRVPLYADHSRSVLRRSANYVSFALSAAVLGPLLAEAADVMLVYHPPVTLGVPALALRVLRRLPYVYEIQDLWPETLPATGMVRQPTVLRILDALGRLTYRHAEALTVISNGFKRNLVEKGVDPAKIHVMPNWGYEGEFPLVKRDETLAESLGMAGRFNVLYAGNMGPAQALENVVKASSRLTDCPDVQFVLVGDGVARADLEAAARTSGGSVRFLARQSMDRMPSLYAIADALLIHLSDDPLFSVTIPGKTQSCLASGKPVLVAVRGEAAAMVAESGAGVAVPPGDPDALAAAVRRLRALSTGDRAAMGPAGRRYYLTNLSPTVLIPRYEALLERAASRVRRFSPDVPTHDESGRSAN